MGEPSPDLRSYPPFAVGPRVRALREAYRMSLSELAQRAGISKAYLSQLENDPRKKPSAEVVWKLAQALEVPMTRLLGVEDHPSLQQDALPPGLRLFWAEHPEVSEEEIRMLAGIHVRGRRPFTAVDYWLIYETIRAAARRHGL